VCRSCSAISFACFSARICRTEERIEKLKPIERKGRRHRAERRRPTQTENKGKRVGTDEHGQTSQHAFNIVAAPSFFSRSVIQFCMHFLVACVTIQVKFNSLEQ
jgi:hypothetical protein